MDFLFAKIYPSYKSSTKFPDTNPAGILRIHIGEYFYAPNYFIPYSNRIRKHQDKEDPIAFVLSNPPLLYLEYHSSYSSPKTSATALNTTFPFTIFRPLYSFIFLAGLSPTLISKRQCIFQRSIGQGCSRGIWDSTRNISYCIMNDSIDHICRIRMCGWMRCLETATLIDCYINKYSSWLHQFQHIFRDKMRRLITGTSTLPTTISTSGNSLRILCSLE